MRAVVRISDTGGFELPLEVGRGVRVSVRVPALVGRPVRVGRVEGLVEVNRGGSESTRETTKVGASAHVAVAAVLETTVLMATVVEATLMAVLMATVVKTTLMAMLMAAVEVAVAGQGRGSGEGQSGQGDERQSKA